MYFPYAAQSPSLSASCALSYASFATLIQSAADVGSSVPPFSSSVISDDVSSPNKDARA